MHIHSVAILLVSLQFVCFQIRSSRYFLCAESAEPSPVPAGEWGKGETMAHLVSLSIALAQKSVQFFSVK